MAGYVPRRDTDERLPIPALTGLDVEQLRRCDQRRYYRSSHVDGPDEAVGQVCACDCVSGQ